MNEEKFQNDLFNLLFEVLTSEQIDEIYDTIVDMIEENNNVTE
jgi:hypothetical protein